jgi:uncharacterized protein
MTTKSVSLTNLRGVWKPVSVVLISICLVIPPYHNYFGQTYIDSLVLYLMIPLAYIFFVLRDPITDYGLTLGDWRSGLRWLAAALPFVPLMMIIGMGNPNLRSFYEPYYSDGVGKFIKIGLEMVGWEFIFRGFLLFALYRLIGPFAIVIQAIPFTIRHIGKPEIELWSCMFGGSLLGYIAIRTRSFFYPFLIHWYLTSITVLLAHSL